MNADQYYGYQGKSWVDLSVHGSLAAVSIIYAIWVPWKSKQQVCQECKELGADQRTLITEDVGLSEVEISTTTPSKRFSPAVVAERGADADQARGTLQGVGGRGFWKD